MTILLGLLTPFLGTLLAILSSLTSIFATSLTAVAPILTAISSFLVWYVKSFFAGLKEIILNLDTLTVFGSAILVSGLYLQHINTVNLIQQVNLQRAYDARLARQGQCPPVHSSIKPPSFLEGLWPDFLNL
jgi:hypothetical protein